jgi:hypothetical protein
MIARMRRWLLLVMVLLLPLRGWVGEAMAGQMLQQHGALISAAAGDPVRPAHASGHDHAPDHAHPPGHAHAGGDAQSHDCDHGPAAGDASGPASGHADCPTCASCQVCSSVALSTMAWLPTPIAYSHPQPEAAQPSYASAEPALAFKPPRS